MTPTDTSTTRALDPAHTDQHRTRVRSRRNPTLMAAGAVAALVGAVFGAWMLTSITRTSAVLVLARPVPAGALLTSADLTTAQLPADPAIATIPAEQRSAVVGQRATGDLPAGAVLAPGSTTSQPVPGPAMSVVGVALRPSQMPAMPLGVGDQVRLVVGVREGDPAPKGQQPELGAEVAGLQVGQDATTVVDLTVPEQLASQVATWASTGRVVLILDSGAAQ